MADAYVTEKECTLINKNTDDEMNRMNHRIDILETNIAEIHKLSLSIERLTLTVQNMVNEQMEQRTKLDVLESQDGEKWRKVVWLIISGIVGLAIGVMTNKLGL